MAAVAMACAFSCARGMPGPDEFGRSQPLGNAANQLPAMASGGVGGSGGMGGMAGTMPATPPTIMGPPCKMGERVDCTCDDGVMLGVQMCMFDPMSPTQGSLGMCMQCKPPEMMEPRDAGMMAGEGGMGGMAGMAGSAGSTAGSGGMAGMSGSGGSGSGGMAGSGMMCVAANCPRATGLFGIEREKCCTRGGRCGGINALSGDCETN